MLQKPSSAPVRMVEGINIDRKVLHRRSTGSCKRKRKSIKMPSSSSLHSLVSILKTTPSESNRQSVPNVSFDSDCNEIKLSDDLVNDENVTTTNACVNEPSEYHIAVAMDSVDVTESTQQSSTIGLRASLFSVLTKLGVWRSEDLYKAPASDGKFPNDKKTTRNSVTSLFRTFYGGNGRIIFSLTFFHAKGLSWDGYLNYFDKKIFLKDVT
jgi:hypothetical protein